LALYTLVQVYLVTYLLNHAVFESRMRTEYAYRLCFTAGSLLESISHAIEQASAVLVCFSEKYKYSPFCRTGYYIAQWSVHLHCERAKMLQVLVTGHKYLY